MKTYSTQNIRNVVLLGSTRSGKTTLAEAMLYEGKVDCGICICGTGVGISLAANKVRGIRAVVCSEPYSAKLSKQHNNTNVLCFGARVIGIELAKMIIDAWLGAEFEGGRHATRVGMIMDIENEKYEG